MPLYTLAGNSLTPVPVASYVEAKVFEVRDLQPAIIDAIEAVAPGTLVIDHEHRGWEEKDLRIDILGIDKAGHLVVVELKRTGDGGALDLQALRYAAMVSTYSFERVVDVFQAHRSKAGLPAEDADCILREHLELDGDAEAAVADSVRIVLVSAGFSKDVTSTVIWLNSQGLDISCVRIVPHRIDDRMLVDIEQIIPLPETAAYVLAQRQKTVAAATAQKASGRDYTKFDLVTPARAWRRLNKRRLAYEVVKLAFDAGASAARMEAAVPWKPLFLSAPGRLGAEQVLAAHPDADEYRYFSRPGEEFVVDGVTHLLSNQWGTRTREAAEAIGALLPDPTGVTIEAV